MGALVQVFEDAQYYRSVRRSPLSSLKRLFTISCMFRTRLADTGAQVDWDQRCMRELGL